MKYTKLVRVAAGMFVPVFWFACGGGPGPTILSASPQPTMPSASSQPAPGQAGRQTTSLDPPGEVDIYVAPSGSDQTGGGTRLKPYRTISRAMQDIPLTVTEHYVLNLAKGTYPEKLDLSGRLFPTNATLSQSAIELKGDPSSPDSYVISGADVGAPSNPVRDYCIQSTSQNTILNGVSLEYARVAGFLQRGGNALLISSTSRHHTTSGALGIWTRQGSMTEMRGNLTISDVANGMEVDSLSHFVNLDPLANNGLWALFGSSSDAIGTFTITGVTTGVGLQAGQSSVVELQGTSNFTGSGTSQSGTVGVQAWENAEIDMVWATISDFDVAVNALSSGKIYIDTPTISTANTGVLVQDDSLVDWFVSNPTFTNVTTPYSIAQSGRVIGQSGLNLFGGNLTSTGAVNVTAGGTNQNVTLTPSGSGSIVFNGVVGIGGQSTGAKLMISSPGGDQTYVDIADLDAKKDTLVNLNATGTSDDTFFLRARSNGSDRWWVKSDGATFSTSLSTGVNEIPFSPSPAFDASLGNIQNMTLAGDVVSSTLLNASPGQTLVFLICQDASGGHKFTWPPNVKGGVNIGAVNPLGVMIAGAPNTCTAQGFIFVGADAYSVGFGSTNM